MQKTVFICPNAHQTNRQRYDIVGWRSLGVSLADQQDWLDGQPSKADQTERATELAEGAIDQLSQDSASTSDIANRKRRLTEGPSEFRDDWIDQSSKRE